MNKGFLRKKFTERRAVRRTSTRKIAIRRTSTKKMIAFALSVIIAVSITGCKNSDSEKETVNHTDNSGNSSVEQTSVSEYGYNIEYIDFSEEAEGLYQPVLSGSTVYFTQSSNTSYMLSSFDLSAPEAVKTYVSFLEGGDIRHEIRYPHPNNDGTITFIHREYSFSDLSHQGKTLDLGDIPENDDITEEYLSELNVDLADLGLDFDDISGLSVKEFATLYKSLTDSGTYISDAWGNGTVLLTTVDAEGNEKSSINITDNFKDIRSCSAGYDNEGNMYMYNEKWAVSENHQYITEYFILKINLKTGETEKFVLDEELDTLFAVASGDIVAITYSGNSGKPAVKIWDKEKNAFSDKEMNLSASTFEEAYPAYDDMFYYTDNGTDNLYLYDLSEGKDEQVLRFIDWDISDNMSMISYIDENHMVMFGSCIYRLTKVKTSELVKKKIITLACLYTYGETKTFIADFNRTNSEYRIQIKNYMSDDVIDYDEAITSLTKDILSNPPDLISLDGLDYARYSGSGVFENLYSFMEKDEEFKNRNLNKNILKLFEIDGALYALPSTYRITALASEKSLLGDEPFTLDKYIEIAEANTDKDTFHNVSREELLKTLFSTNEDYLIDYKTKTCNFTDGTFEKILNITKSFPSAETLMDMQDLLMISGEYVPPLQRISEGTLLFYPLNIYNIREYRPADFIFNGSLNITGYPSVEGNKVAINSFGSLYAISSQSEYKDVCWKFIKELFNEETQTAGTFGFVVDNDVFEENLKQMAEPVMKSDENGNLVEVPERMGEGNVEMEFYAPSEELISQIRSLIDSINTLLPVYTAGDIYKILIEEASPFYAGDKTAEEVCTVIQSRINLLINEEN